jgi:hypothetical protein
MHYHLIKEESWYVSKGEFEYRWIDTETATEIKLILKKEICRFRTWTTSSINSTYRRSHNF